MNSSIKKKEFIQKLASKMNADEQTATSWLDGVTDTFYDTFRNGKAGIKIFFMPSMIVH